MRRETCISDKIKLVIPLSDLNSNRLTRQDLIERVVDLERQLSERTRELEVYQAVTQAINRQLEVEKVLQMIADNARLLTNTQAATVYLLENDVLRLEVVSGTLPTDVPIGFELPLEHSVAGLAIRDRKPYCVPDAAHDERVYSQAVQRSHIQSFLIVPLFSGDNALGVISVADKLIGVLGAEDERILSLLAANVVIGLENARLYAQAAETAVLVERNRLGRELHDAVTQSLFSASLIADVLPRIWKENPQEGERRLEELRRLSRGALAEMRSLLLELRPAALEEAALPDLLRHLGNAFTGKTQVPVQLVVDSGIVLPTTVKIGFYRIAQESFNNIAKHAEAENVLLHLQRENEQVILEILDDGQGFNLADVPEGHLGINIMRERAESIGASLEIFSKPGEGTRLLLTWKLEGALHDR